MDLSKLRELNLRETKQKIKDSVTEDILLIQVVHAYDELVKAESRLLNVLKEWYGYYFPELIEKENFIDYISEDKKSLMRRFDVKESIGKELEKEDLNQIFNFANKIKEIRELKNNFGKHIEEKMNNIASELSKAATPLIGAKLIEKAGSLKHLAELPSSTIQILGSEKALFRHLRTGAKSPKYGVIFSHPDIIKCKIEERGKVSRKLAARISIAVKKDYFRK